MQEFCQLLNISIQMRWETPRFIGRWTCAKTTNFPPSVNFCSDHLVCPRIGWFQVLSSKSMNNGVCAFMCSSVWLCIPIYLSDYQRAKLMGHVPRVYSVYTFMDTCVVPEESDTTNVGQLFHICHSRLKL